MNYTWVQVYKAEWRLILNYDGIYPSGTCIATVYRYGGGWRGVVHPSRHKQDEVMFLEPSNLVDIKLLLEATIALRENGDGV